MKAQIHPKWFSDAKVICACGNTFTTGSTLPEVRVDVCYACHPFYTGQMKFVDAAGRVDSFRAKMAAIKSTRVSKTEKRRLKREKRLAEEASRPETLSELRSVDK